MSAIIVATIEPINVDIVKLDDGSDYPQRDCPIYATLRDGVIRHVTDEVFWRKDGTSFPVDYSCTPVYE